MSKRRAKMRIAINSGDADLLRKLSADASSSLLKALRREQEREPSSVKVREGIPLFVPLQGEW